MNYRQIAPPDYLKDHVRYFWILESDADDTSDKTFRPLPDGLPGIVFQSDSVDFYAGDYKMPDIYLYGQTTEQTTFSSKGRVSNIGVYFYPHALKTVFGLNAYELTNTCLDIGLIKRPKQSSLYEQMLNANTNEERLELLCHYMRMKLEQQKSNDNVMQHALSLIYRSNGGMALKQLQQELKLSERSIERKFNQQIGISAKLFSRICRFQSSLKLLRNNEYNKLSDVAYESNYADQSHFIRAFKEFTGMSPNEYQKWSNEIVENFPIIKK